MSLVDHLEELRWRILWCILYWAVGVVAAYQYMGTLLALTQPMLQGHKLIFTGPTELFFTYLNASMVLGACLASPVFLYHVLMFVLPGLEANERKWVFRLLPLTIFQFLLGAAFAIKMVLPGTLGFFMSFSQPGVVEAQIRVSEFLGFITTLTVICGLVFELPIVLMFLAGIGIVSSRFLARHRRMAYFLSFVVAAVATPTPDAFTATVVALPILLNYEVSVWLIRILGK